MWIELKETLINLNIISGIEKNISTGIYCLSLYSGIAKIEICFENKEERDIAYNLIKEIISINKKCQ